MDKYRVIVLREGDGTDETLFEVAGSASLVQHIVPGVLDTVLAGSEVAPAPERSLADRVFDSAVAAGAAGEQQAEVPPAPAGETEEAATKRKRRTKQQIADDKEAQAAGFRDAAHRAEVEEAQRQANTQQVAAVPAEAPAAPYMTPDGPVAPEQAPAAAAPALPATPPAGTGVAAAPAWNPFVQ